MNGIKAIMRKELSDHFSSYRFIILFAVIAMISLIMVYMVGVDLHQNSANKLKPEYIFLKLFTSNGDAFSLVQFVALFGPLIGLILGFDTINREKNEGTMSKLLSQPIYRDAIINGKFLAGVLLITVMMLSIILVITGLGLILLGIVPGVEEILRISIYLVISIIYISFWLGVAILCSIIFRSVATSALATLAIWIFFSFFVSLGANAIANSTVTDQYNTQQQIQKIKLNKALAMISPLELYSDSTKTIINPELKTAGLVFEMGVMEQASLLRFYGPLPLKQSILMVLPHIIFLIAITLICFAISYTVFMRQEIRSL